MQNTQRDETQLKQKNDNKLNIENDQQDDLLNQLNKLTISQPSLENISTKKLQSKQIIQQALNQQFETARSESITTEEQIKIQSIFDSEYSNTKQLQRINPLGAITYRSFCTLNNKKWINDEVINTYIEMLNKQQNHSGFKIMNTFFSVVIEKNMDKILLKNKITKQTKIIIPIHWNNNHWFFVTIVDGIIKVYDSMINHGIPKSISQLSNRLFNKAEISIAKFPKQQGFEDCGVFMIKGIKCVFHNQKLEFCQQHIFNQRMLIAKHILYSM